MLEMEQWDFDSINAPQFYDFTKGTPDQSTSFFARSDEDEASSGPEETMIMDSSHDESKGDHQYAMAYRRSMSCGDVSYLSEAIISLIVTEANRDEQFSSSNVCTTSRQTEENKLKLPAQAKTERKSHELSNSVNVSEAPRLIQLNKLQSLTEKQTEKDMNEPSNSMNLHVTSAQIQQNKLQPSAQKRNELKATNSKVIIVKPKETKTTAVHISEKNPKIANEGQHLFNFHARPAPNCTKNPPMINPVAKKGIAHKNQSKIENNLKINKPKRTQVLPFSFEVRDLMLQRKKNELVKKVLEAEKRAREFHARPIPKGLLKPLNMSQKTAVETAQEIPIFKARPAKVLQKKPFEPKKAEKPPTKVHKFVLNTDKRSKAWEEFQEQLKQKESDKEREKRFLEEQRQQQEEKERREFRKLAQYVAQPIKKYKPVEIKSAHKVTVPQSPNFLYRNRKQTKRVENKENENV